jgi:hypothetical protein
MMRLTLLGWMFLAWSMITSALVLLLIYRSVVEMKEDDQLFLDKAEAQFEKEQHEILKRLDQITPYLKGLGIASGGLLAAMIGLVIYNASTAV